MEPMTWRQRAMRGSVIPISLLMMFFGFLIANAGYVTLKEWSSISVWLAACAVIWMVAGPAMIVAGVWTLVSLGRHRLPQWVGGLSAAAASVVLIVGILSFVIPCSGPS